MKFEVTDRREEKTGLIFKKPVYLARARIHFDTDEFEALKSMAASKQWKVYPLGEVRFTDRITSEVTVEGLYNWAKKTGSYEKGIRTSLPEERELQIQEVQEVAQNAKKVIDTRLSALSQTDEDVSIEL